MAKSLSDIVRSSSKIAFFGGAGVSTESGIPDFRSADGLFSRDFGRTVPPEEALSRSFFTRHTGEFYAYYLAHLLHPQARPNDAHRALASLERAGKLTAVVTQNIDGLHQAAGSKRVLELHGSVHRNYCLVCGKTAGLDAVPTAEPVPRCGCGGVIRPDVVLYGEPLDEAVMSQAIAAIAEADTLIVGGTSLAVYPAAGLVHVFRGEHLVLINRDPTPYDYLASLVVRTPIGQALAPFVDWGDG